MTRIPPRLIFPSAIILAYLGAGVVYAVRGEVRLAIYSFSAAVLTASVTF